MIDFPLDDVLDEQACLDWLERHLHPEGLACPHCQSHQRRLARQNRYFPAYTCLECGTYYSLYTGTIFEKTRQPARTLVMLLRGVAKGESTARLARELNLSRMQAHTLRRRIQENLFTRQATHVLEHDTEVEVDELYQNAGEKIYPTHRARRPATPPRKQASRARHV